MQIVAGEFGGVNPARRAVVLSTVAVLAYASGVFLAGWKIGGRPGGWYEGKALVFPAALWTLWCGLVAFAGLVNSLLPADDVPSPGVVSWWGAAVIVFASAVLALFVYVLVTSFGLGPIYAIASWRRAMWEH